MRVRTAKHEALLFPIFLDLGEDRSQVVDAKLAASAPVAVLYGLGP